MKKLIVPLFFMLSFFTVTAQISINTTNVDPDASAMLDISSVQKGGTQGAGKILTSYAAGFATWQTPSDNVNDADADPNNEIELPSGGTAGQFLTTDGMGTVAWDTSTDNVNDADADPTNEIELPQGGMAGQFLKTDGMGTVTWDTPTDNVNDADADMVGDVCDTCPNGDDMVDINANNIIDDCECQGNSLNLSGTLAATKNYISGNTINSTEMINTGLTSMYKATNSITLSSGFYAKAGTDFLVVVSPCQNPAELQAPIVNQITKESSTSTSIGQATLAVSPNPFVRQTEIEYTVPSDGKLTLTIHDFTGQELAILLENQEQIKGTHSITYHAAGLASGMYLLTMTTGQQIISEQLVIVNDKK